MGIQLDKKEFIELFNHKKEHVRKKREEWINFKKEKEIHHEKEMEKYHQLNWFKRLFDDPPLLRYSYGFRMEEMDLFVNFLQRNEIPLMKSERKLDELEEVIEPCHNDKIFLTDEEMVFLKRL